MKKLLLGSIAFFLFSISVSILQTSCDKDAAADPDSINNETNLKKLLYCKMNGSDIEYWTADYNGSGQTKINIILPAGYKTSYTAFISPDGEKIFFQATKNMNNTWEEYIFSCNIDGSNVKQVMFLGAEDLNRFVDVY